MKDKEKRKRLAPYVAVGTLSGFFDRIRRISTPTDITSVWLEDVGISRSDAFALMSALRFLSLIDKRGLPTEEFRSLQTSGDEFKRNLEKVIRTAYADLFSILDPSVDDREHVMNFFARNYSPATAQKATALFLDLCGEAGIATKAGSLRRKKAEEDRKITVTRGSMVKDQHPDNKNPFFEIRIDSKDFASMQPEQIRAFFEGLNKVTKQEEKTEESN